MTKTQQSHPLASIQNTHLRRFALYTFIYTESQKSRAECFTDVSVVSL